MPLQKAGAFHAEEAIDDFERKGIAQLGAGPVRQNDDADFPGGHEHNQRTDAIDVAAVMRDLNPDVILLDWMMDGMTGLDFVKMVRTSSASANPFVPIIMLTGYTQVDHVRAARDAGVNEFLAKPVSVKAVMTRLTAVIEHPRSYVRTKVYFGPCRRRRGHEEYRGPERRTAGDGIPIDNAEAVHA